MMYTRRIINHSINIKSIFNACQPHFSGTRRRISTGASEIQTKYSQKLRQKAQEAGVSLPQLIEKARLEQRELHKSESQQLKASLNAVNPGPSLLSSVKTKSSSTSTPLPNSRKDASPVKALSSILNLPRIMSKPHTADQISGLWTAYHASRSNGTGRGYLCATIPLNIYKKMEQNGRLYPSFVVPIPRIQSEQETDPLEENPAHEFYFLQWTFHASPPIPSPSDDPFTIPTTSGSNPQTSIILFTPLQEYKIRDSFATPYLILTIYTDFAETHGLVLLRGEITPSTASGSGSADRYMLSQADAQLLAMTLQKFYLWSDNDSDLTGEKLLYTFHQNPQEFKWQDLLKFSKTII